MEQNDVCRTSRRPPFRFFGKFSINIWFVLYNLWFLLVLMRKLLCHQFWIMYLCLSFLVERACDDGYTVRHAGQYLNGDISRFPNFMFLRELSGCWRSETSAHQERLPHLAKNARWPRCFCAILIDV